MAGDESCVEGFVWHELEWCGVSGGRGGESGMVWVECLDIGWSGMECRVWCGWSVKMFREVGRSIAWSVVERNDDGWIEAECRIDCKVE